MKYAFGALATACALIGAMPAHAAAMNFVVDGIFSHGQKLSGGFEIDKDKSGKIFNVDLKVDQNVFTEISTLSGGGAGMITLGFSPAKGSGGFLFLVVPSIFQSSLSIFSITEGSLGSKSVVFAQDGTQSLISSGSITLAPAAAVPEPATWALMILGFGAVGYAMRRKKVAVRFP